MDNLQSRFQIEVKDIIQLMVTNRFNSKQNTNLIQLYKTYHLLKDQV